MKEARRKVYVVEDEETIRIENSKTEILGDDLTEH